MRTILTLLTVLILNSCGQKNDNKNSENFRTFNIEFAKIEIDLPPSFIKSTSDKLIENLNKADRPKEYLDALTAKIIALENSPMGYKHIADTTNFTNNIIFYGGEYVYITKSIAQQYIRMLENQLEQEWIPMGRNFNRLESRFFLGKNVQIIKVKYRYEINNYISYSTQYVISTDRKTFAMVVNSATTEDFEEQVKTIRLRKEN